ncbi:DAK2 domain-containing protein [Mycolicibacterium palauense]|uniref:DAK2 domain-containing protein n=1 Tax=Mycolicibacterium palauense TaxID=2034511 RepID=UPI000BFF0861|nr:DAK2 domain-containing protein [Mycolicibacterium palauense]
MSDRRLDGTALRDWAHTAVGDLIARTDEINRLNVFPVADADTGTNMLFTMRSALAEARSAAGSGDVVAVTAALSEGALHGARGNSGVILSQILRGLADVTASVADDTRGELGAIDAAVLAAALRHAVGLVVASMGGDAVAGTIVSVLQAAAEAAERSAGDGDPVGGAASAAAEAAVAALENTPAQLPVLAESGVVDAGGRGLVVLLDALSATLTGHVASRRPYQPARPPEPAPHPAPPAAPQFEVMYLLDSGGRDIVEALRARLTALGDSVVIAAAHGTGGAGRQSVHVHTDDAGAAVEAGLAFGRPSAIKISALGGGTGLAPGSWSTERAVLAVVDGDGAAELFAAEGAAVLRPDPAELQSVGVGVSARQLLRALVDTGAAQVMVLPNGYVAAAELVAACTAAIGWGIDVVPVPTGSMVQGLAALAVHDAGRQAVDDGFTMAAAAAETRYGSVRLAAEDALTWAGPCRTGDGLGVVGGEVLVVRRGIAAAARGLIDLLLTVGGELVTVLLGTGVSDDVAEALGDHVRRHHLATELVSYRTGHAGDAVIIGVE